MRFPFNPETPRFSLPSFPRQPELHHRDRFFQAENPFLKVLFFYASSGDLAVMSLVPEDPEICRLSSGESGFFVKGFPSDSESFASS